MSAAQVLRLARQRAGLTQVELARRSGTKQSAIARWEKGAVSPRVDTLERLLRACGFEPVVTFTAITDEDQNQLLERLAWTPRQRLDYLVDMIAFEERAHRARKRPRSSGPGSS